MSSLKSKVNDKNETRSIQNKENVPRKNDKGKDIMVHIKKWRDNTDLEET